MLHKTLKMDVDIYVSVSDIIHEIRTNTVSYDLVALFKVVASELTDESLQHLHGSLPDVGYAQLASVVEALACRIYRAAGGEE